MRYFDWNGTRYEEEDIERLVEEIIPEDYFDDDSEGFNDYLNDNYGVEVDGYDFDAADVLYTMNEDAYYNAMHDWSYSERQNAMEDACFTLSHADIGQRVYVQDEIVYVRDDSDETATGDTDGDVKVDMKMGVSLEELENAIEEIKRKTEEIEAENRKNENAFMSIFGNESQLFNIQQL